MRPVLFQFRGREVRAYPVFLIIGLTVGIIVGTKVGASRGHDPTRLYVALILMTIPALVGSRILFILTHLDHYRAGRKAMWAPTTDGAALYGGLILMLLCSFPLLRVLGLGIGAFWDIAAITIVTALAIAKIGCLLNGCCNGRPTSSRFGVELSDSRGIRCRRFPAQVYESLLASVLLVGALLWTTPPFEGAVFLTALAIYSAARLAIGFIREHADNRASKLSYYAVSAFFLVTSVAALALNIA